MVSTSAEVKIFFDSAGTFDTLSSRRVRRGTGWGRPCMKIVILIAALSSGLFHR